MRDCNHSKLFTMKNSKLYPSKTKEILGFISQNILNSTHLSSTNSKFNSSEPF